ncbi:unnamed protein product [Vitrella brassicaformis CCMP3155]|uniref:Hypoxanthine phosphoribosyltransferase n=2 Tax=Vitrella brassicaformis TaxID=1169539 RepID=A0A0G4GBF6_VITBC|nr:unnamed protein product [Vitrella brassicaformis CCMP3155]|mmetsp:Transcript_39544/g.112784  ORF Transcript_39544/g.112784 Transcript_39544/m.112784 type:complete len:251 (+) Transcript_39544:85-837(+)|eukprot:CEM26301.1 unnamed protein product [Vitrella brassicaformis CCMP3155]
MYSEPPSSKHRPTLQNPGSGEGRSEPVYISDDTGYALSHFLLPSHYQLDLERVLIPAGFILDRIEKLAHDIKTFYGDQDLHVLCILKGSRGFFNHLLSYLNKIHMYGRPYATSPPYMEHYVRLRSYVGTDSSGQLEVIAEDLSILKNKHVLIVEDIIDTGNTLTKFCDYLRAIGPKSIGIASLLEKRTDKSNGFRGDFVGFSCPDAFVVGFSLDYNEMFRDLEHLCIINDQAKQRYSSKRRPSVDNGVAS